MYFFLSAVQNMKKVSTHAALSVDLLCWLLNKQIYHSTLQKGKHPSGDVTLSELTAGSCHSLHSRRYLLLLFVGRISRSVEVFLHYETPGCCLWGHGTKKLTVFLYFDPNFSRMPTHHFSSTEFRGYTSKRWRTAVSSNQRRVFIKLTNRRSRGRGFQTKTLEDHVMSWQLILLSTYKPPL